MGLSPGALRQHWFEYSARFTRAEWIKRGGRSQDFDKLDQDKSGILDAREIHKLRKLRDEHEEEVQARAQLFRQSTLTRQATRMRESMCADPHVETQIEMGQVGVQAEAGVVHDDDIEMDLEANPTHLTLGIKRDDGTLSPVHGPPA